MFRLFVVVACFVYSVVVAASLTVVYNLTIIRGLMEAHYRS